MRNSRMAGFRTGLVVMGSVLLLSVTANVFAEEACTEFSTVPFVIKKAGHYCMAADISAPENARQQFMIMVLDNNVTLDLRGYRLSGPGSGMGIAAMQRSDVVIQNGTISDFDIGIALMSMRSTPVATNNTFRNLKLLNNRLAGIVAVGDKTVIQNNVIKNTGGASKPLNGAYKPGTAFGINVNGSEIQITGNTINGTTATLNGVAYGIYLEWSPNSIIANNTIYAIISIFT